MGFGRIAVLSAAVAAVGCLVKAPAVQASTVVADYTLSQDASGYPNPSGNSGNGSAPEGLPLDSVGGHNFLNSFGGPVPSSFGGNVGGPSATSSQFNGGVGFYGTAAGTTTLPTNNFAVEVHASVTATGQGDLFSSSGGTAGQLQIGEDSSGHWIAYVTNSSNNNAGTVLGTANVALSTPTDLMVTDIGNVFTFYVNGVATGPGVTPATSFAGFGGMHIAVAPGGGGPNYNGLVSDLTITSGVTTPEPASLSLLGLGSLGLLARRRRA